MTYIGKRAANLLFVIMVLLISGLMLYSLEMNTANHIRLSEQKLVQEAMAHFDNMVITRSWNAMHGGVYVKSTQQLEPNPYLKDNFILDSQGNKLIKINPAWMTRQISELSNKSGRYYYKITSLKPLNPHNAADAFETEALTYFENHKQDKYYYRFSEDKQKFDFMGGLSVEPPCLGCHQEQGYKLGDIRGGIRVSIPTDLFQQELNTLLLQKRDSQIFILTCAMLVILIFFRFLAAVYRHQQAIEELNQSLEKKVVDKTHALEKMYQHEKYIKDLLKTVSGVNELLLSSISVQNVLQHSSEELTKHKHYRFTWVGIIKDNLLEVAHKSTNNPEIVPQNVYQLSGDLDNQQTCAALQAITENRTIVEHYRHIQLPGRRTNDYVLHWLVAIPLVVNDNERPFGVFNIYSDREVGFEEEEIRVLERLSTDISLILHSHKQKAVLERMEVERISNYEETILAFVNIIEQRDTYTAGHTIRVAQYCKKIATELQVSARDIEKLGRAAILHDIGKVATPDAVLLKPGKLSALEYELIKQHAYAGFNMLSKIDMYKDLAEIIRYHHARYDGNGYPKTSSPDEIPFLSHIMAVADAFDAMTTNRIYKPRQTVANALAEIERYGGTQFHPQVVTAAIKALKDIEIPQTNQTPSTELEQKRFSYFFSDALTGIYNDSYLQIILANSERKHCCLYLILLSHFSEYNKQYGWEQGDKLLIQLAKSLQERFPDALVFRYHGDDFVLLFKQHTGLSPASVTQLPLLLNNTVEILVKHLDLEASDYEMKNIYYKLSQNFK